MSGHRYGGTVNGATYLAADLASGPYVTTEPKGSGTVTCECINHRSRCLFGRSHSWSQWYFEGRRIGKDDTFYCYAYGAVCAGSDVVADVRDGVERVG